MDTASKLHKKIRKAEAKAKRLRIKADRLERKSAHYRATLLSWNDEHWDKLPY